MSRRLPPSRIGLGLLLLALILGGAILARAHPGGPAGLIQSGMNAARRLGPGGMVLFGLAQGLVAFSGILPASLVGVAAGAIYGVALGFPLAAISTMAGAWLAFCASRSLFRPRIERLLAGRPRLRQLDATLARERWRFVCLLRVSPIMPFAVTSYVLGLSAVAMRDYLLGTLAALPALLGYVCLGGLARASLAASLTGAAPLHWALLGIGVLATILLTLRIGQLLRRSGLLSQGDLPQPAAPPA